MRDLGAQKSTIESCDLYSDITTNIKNHFGTVQDIVCYGIGNFLSCKKSLHQLALLVLLYRQLNVLGDSFIFDPMLTEEEKVFVQKLGHKVIEKNEEGKREVVHRTVFFMPHCTKPLYSNVLWANWSPSKLANVAILGNSFSHYNERLIQKSGKNINVDYVERIHLYTTEVPLQGASPLEEAFTDTSLHVFAQGTLEAAQGLWADSSEPPPFKDDPELIGAS